MVKFLFAKEKTRVRFPLSAEEKTNYYDIVIVDHGSVVILSVLFFFIALQNKNEFNDSNLIFLTKEFAETGFEPVTSRL